MLHKSEEKKVLALQKHLTEGCIKGDHLLKKSGWSDQCLHFYEWFSGCQGCTKKLKRGGGETERGAKIYKKSSL